MFYIIVVAVERLTQLWPLLLVGITSIAVCHFAAKYISITNNKTAVIPSKSAVNANNVNFAITDSGKQDYCSITAGEHFLTPKRSSCFISTNSPVTVITTKDG